MSLDLGAHERIDALTRRIEALERALHPPREFANVCPKCGMELLLGSTYVCPRPLCPCGRNKEPT